MNFPGAFQQITKGLIHSLENQLNTERSPKLLVKHKGSPSEKQEFFLRNPQKTFHKSQREPSRGNYKYERRNLNRDKENKIQRESNHSNFDEISPFPQLFSSFPPFL